MTPRTARRLLDGACLSALAALGLMVWSLFDPRPIPVIAAMSVGQVLGTLSLATFGYVVLSDIRARMARRREDQAPSTPSDPLE